ncbi:MAG: glycosyltransferase [Verrucomicrobia bacterium]|nr:glycosyltransferase [Verrucomicrobiota bacterium]MBI3869715.1 glycosyltransferase [Verrucomicrobiota bacterium]
MAAFLHVVLAITALQSVLLALWQHALALRFAFQQDTPPRSLSHGPAPSISVLKPLKGHDHETAKNLESWLAQEYPAGFEILFGVASAEDPVGDVVREAMSRHSRASARLILCPPNGAANPKVSTLTQLEAVSAHGTLVVSDADVRVSPHCLAHLARTLVEPGAGLAHSIYRLQAPGGWGGRIESVGVNADFWPQVLQARSFGMLDFALGAVMCLRRETLKGIGGFQAIQDHLADDFQLGNRISRRGLRIELAPTRVECWGSGGSLGETWAHMLRWTRTVRACKPGPFFLSILGNQTLWPLLWAATTRSALSWSLMATWIVARVLLASARIQKLSGRSDAPTDAWLAPAHDLVQAALWLAAHFGRTVRWAGKAYAVGEGGKMTLLPGEASRNWERAPG